MAEIVYTAVADATGIHGSLFQGVKFWLSQKVPQRSRFIEEVKVGHSPSRIPFQDPANSTTGKANGGEVMYSEEEAEVKIVDPARKPQLPGRYVHPLRPISRRYNMEIGFLFSTSRTPCAMVLWKILKTMLSVLQSVPFAPWVREVSP